MSAAAGVRPSTAGTAPGETPGSAADTAEAVSAAALAALGSMLAVEHAAVYACATAGGTLAPAGDGASTARGLARSAYEAHRKLRDALAAAILSGGGEPPAARAAYALPTQPADSASALGLLADVEDRAAAAAFDAVAALGPAHRQLAIDALAGAAVRAQRARLAARLAPERAGRALPGR